MSTSTSTDTMRASPSLTTTHSSSSSEAPADSSINHKDAISYWSSISPTVNGMLGGFPQISRIDIQGSRNFIGKLIRRRDREAAGAERSIKRPRVEAETASDGERNDGTAQSQEGESTDIGPDEKEEHRYPRRETNQSNPSATSAKPPLVRAVDCGAGIGRITHGVLLSLAYTVDIVEPVEQFTREISEGETFAAYRPPNKSTSSIGQIYIIGLESWEPRKDTYDLIWNQWCLGQLTDSQLVSYLQRCGPSLRSGGWIVVKENTLVGGDDVFDETDSSVTRSEGKFEELFRRAGMKVVLSEVQKGFPKDLGLFPVKSWALQPVNR